LESYTRFLIEKEYKEDKVNKKKVKMHFGLNYKSHEVLPLHFSFLLIQLSLKSVSFLPLPLCYIFSLLLFFLLHHTDICSAIFLYSQDKKQAKSRQ